MTSSALRTTRILAVLGAAAGSLFFLYYSARLASVWSARTTPRPAGMYIGAVAFPCLCLGLGALAWRFARRRD